MTINSGVSEEEVLNCFKNLNLENDEKSPNAPRGVKDLLGQPSCKFDYKVFYSKPPSYEILIKSIVLRGWGDEFEDDKPEGEKKEAKTLKKPRRGVEDLLGQPSSKFDYKVFYSKPPSYDIPIDHTWRMGR